jgi:hypothetical protein
VPPAVVSAFVAIASSAKGSVPPPFSGGSYQRTVLADAPLIYYTLDETSGTLANDLSGNSNNGLYVASPSEGQTPLIATGHSCKFAAASSQYCQANVPGGVPNPGNPIRTVEVWIQTTQSGAGSPAISAAANSFTTEFFLMRLAAGGQLQAVWWSGSTTSTQTGSVVVNDGVKHYVVMTQDGTKSHIYVDGVEDGTGLAWSSSPNTGTLFDHVIAARSNMGSFTNFFDGTLDEAAVYPTALSAARVAAHYAARNS